MARALASMIALTGLSGCYHLPQQPERSELCAFEPIQAKSWVNRMPGPQRSGRKMQVYVQIEPDDTARMLVRVEDKENRLQLDVREWEDGELLPHIGWSMNTQSIMPAGVDIYCGGEMILSINEIETVS